LGCRLRCRHGPARDVSPGTLFELRRRLEGGGEVDQSDSVTYFPEDREAGFVLLCTGKPRSALRIRTQQASEMRQFRRQKKLPAPYS
jgi:hypothetical protein